MVLRGWTLVLLGLMVTGCAQHTVKPVAEVASVEVASAEPVGADAEIDRETATHTLSAKQLIRIDNPYGDVRIRFGGYESVLEWLSLRQNPDTANEITVTGSGDEVFVVSARLPAGTVLAPGQRVDITAYVPEGHDLDIVTEQGLIEARGLHSSLRVRTRSGDISFRGVKGLIDVETASGTIEGQLNRAPDGSQQRIATETGNIILGLAENLDATLKLATSSVFATEFSVQIDPQPGQEPNKIGTAVIGKPKADIEVVSKRGEIRLLRRMAFRPA
jgi:hypothetical protein